MEYGHKEITLKSKFNAILGSIKMIINKGEPPSVTTVQWEKWLVSKERPEQH